MIPLLLTRWKVGMSLAAILAFLGLLMATNFYRHEYRAEKALRASDRASYAQAQIEAQAKAFALRQAEKAAYVVQSERTERAYQTNLASARSAADSYIDRMRIKAAPGAASNSGGERQADTSGLRAGMPAGGVVVSEGDVRACTDASAYALSLRDWAIEVTR